MEIRDKKTDMAIRFVKEWDVVASDPGNAYTAVMCPGCGECFSGHGHSLTESTAEADRKMAAHDCQILPLE